MVLVLRLDATIGFDSDTDTKQPFILILRHQVTIGFDSDTPSNHLF